jgi:hypothetical protein
MSVSERYDQLLAFVSTHLPEPFTQEEADGVVVFTGGSPGEVIVRLTHTAVIVEEFAVRWEKPHGPTLRPRRVGIVRWRRVPESHLMTIVGELIKGARETRRARFRNCAQCGRSNPPERMADASMCRSCAGREVGTVH